MSDSAHGLVTTALVGLYGLKIWGNLDWSALNIKVVDHFVSPLNKNVHLFT